MDEKAQNSAKKNPLDVALALFELTVLLDPKQAEREEATYKWLPLALAFTPETADILVKDSVNHFLESVDNKLDRDAVAGKPTALQFGKQLKAETRKRLAAGAQQMAQALINVSIDLSTDIDPMAALASALGRPASPTTAGDKCVNENCSFCYPSGSTIRPSNNGYTEPRGFKS